VAQDRALGFAVSLLAYVSSMTIPNDDGKGIIDEAMFLASSAEVNRDDTYGLDHRVLKRPRIGCPGKGAETHCAAMVIVTN